MDIKWEMMYNVNKRIHMKGWCEIPDDNDFLSSSFSNYDTTENRMSDSAPGSDGHGGGSQEPHQQHIEIMGAPVSNGKVGIGLAVLIIGIVIGIAISGKQETAAECLVGAGVIIAAIAGAFAIWLHKSK